MCGFLYMVVSGNCMTLLFFFSFLSQKTFLLFCFALCWTISHLFVFYSLCHFMLRVHIRTHLIFCVDELQLWSLNLCTEPPLLYSSPPGCECSVCCCMRWCDCTYVFSQLAHTHTHTHTHTHPHRLTWDIGLANRVLHRSASPDSSLKCPWQPPNPLLSFPLCSCTFFLSGRVPDGCCHISLPRSSLECSHNHWAL